MDGARKPKARPTVLIAQADPATRAAMTDALADRAEVVAAHDAQSALDAMRRHDVHAVLCGPCATPACCADLLARLHEGWPDVQRLLTAAPGREDIVSAIDTAHIHQFLPQPVSPAQLRLAVDAACTAFRLARANARLELELRLRARAPATPAAPPGDGAGGPAFRDILWAPGSPMAAVAAAAARVAGYDVPVLLRGAPATGKAALALAIHRASLRADRPFHAFDCAGLPETVLHLELFGARH